MGRLYGSDFSQTTISRFEALNLRYDFFSFFQLSNSFFQFQKHVQTEANSGTLARRRRTVLDSESTVAFNRSAARIRAAQKETHFNRQFRKRCVTFPDCFALFFLSLLNVFVKIRELGNEPA